MRSGSWDTVCFASVYPYFYSLHRYINLQRASHKQVHDNSVSETES